MSCPLGASSAHISWCLRSLSSPFGLPLASRPRRPGAVRRARSCRAARHRRGARRSRRRSHRRAGAAVAPLTRRARAVLPVRHDPFDRRFCGGNRAPRGGTRRSAKVVATELGGPMDPSIRARSAQSCSPRRSTARTTHFSPSSPAQAARASKPISPAAACPKSSLIICGCGSSPSAPRPPVARGARTGGTRRGRRGDRPRRRGREIPVVALEERRRANGRARRRAARVGRCLARDLGPPAEPRRRRLCDDAAPLSPGSPGRDDRGGRRATDADATGAR